MDSGKDRTCGLPLFTSIGICQQSQVNVVNTDICVITKAKRLMKEVYKLEGDVVGIN